jgi:L-seryl-tRNA(Ser) seleniumtransferase
VLRGRNPLVSTEDMKSAAALRSIPAVEKVLQGVGDCGLPRPLLVSLVRQELAALRDREHALHGMEEVLGRVRSAAAAARLSRIQPVINGTGILVHTNLGRAPLGPALVRTITEIASNYNNLEIDLPSGDRGHRAEYVERCLSLLCGAQAATVVNNCAAALVLILRHLARPPRNEVIISRGELVQIGGGFRIPEILEASGARLREIGTTNKTALSDYAKAVGKQTGLILKVHRSNFFMGGFVESPTTDEIAALARKKRVPFVEDLGSGAMVATESLTGLEHEPTPAEVLKRGVDLVCFSGDKLLGGPQAGIIAGKAKLLAALKREPFYRAFRCDKLILSALQTAAECYLADTAATEIPVLSLAKASLESLRVRAEKIVAQLAASPISASIGSGRAQMGGGTLPRSAMPSVTIELSPRGMRIEQFGERLRTGAVAVIGYAGQGRFKIDLRAVFPHQDDLLTKAIEDALRENPRACED